MNLNGMDLPQHPFKWDALLLKFLLLYLRFIKSLSLPSCVTTFAAKIPYFFQKGFMTCACIHLRINEHPLKNDVYQDFKEKSCILVGEQVKRTLHTTNSAIVMEATKELVRELLASVLGGS